MQNSTDSDSSLKYFVIFLQINLISTFHLLFHVTSLYIYTVFTNRLCIGVGVSLLGDRVGVELIQKLESESVDLNAASTALATCQKRETLIC